MSLSVQISSDMRFLHLVFLLLTQLMANASSDSSDIEVISVKLDSSITARTPRSKSVSLREFVGQELCDSSGAITRASLIAALGNYDVIASQEQVNNMLSLGATVDSLISRYATNPEKA